MKTEIRDKWVEALRSEEYGQGFNSLLRENDKFCCLGVLCSLAAGAGVVNEEQSQRGHYYYDGDSAFLPTSVMQWAGLETSDGRLVNPVPSGHPGGDSAQSLTVLNDSGIPFKEIADVIEAQF